MIRWVKFGKNKFWCKKSIGNSYILKDNRPFYRGMYYINNTNTWYKWDNEGRFCGPNIRARKKIS